MDNKCSETPSLDSQLWYAIGIDGNSSIRIQDCLLVSELNDGTLVLENGLSDEPWIGLQRNKNNALILQLLHSSVEIVVDGKPYRDYALQSGDRVKLPNNQFYVSHQLFGGAAEGHLVEVKVKPVERVEKLPEEIDGPNRLNHPLIVNESVIAKTQASSQEEEIPPLASIITDVPESNSDIQTPLLAPDGDYNVNYRRYIGVAASVILACLGSALLFASFSAEEEGVSLAANDTAQPPSIASVSMDPEAEPVAKLASNSRAVMPALMAPTMSLSLLKETPPQAPLVVNDTVDGVGGVDASEHVVGAGIDPASKSVWAQAYELKGDTSQTEADRDNAYVPELEPNVDISEIDNRLARAKEKLERGEIITPIGKSAVTYLSWYLSEYPENRQAQQLLKLCAQKLVEQAEDDYAHNKTYEARNTLEEVFAFDPYNEHALALWRGWHGQPWSGS